jgi:hypothetical protein
MHHRIHYEIDNETGKRIPDFTMITNIAMTSGGRVVSPDSSPPADVAGHNRRQYGDEQRRLGGTATARKPAETVLIIGV